MVSLLVASFAIAQEAVHEGHVPEQAVPGADTGSTGSSGATSPAREAMEAANEKMHAAMMLPPDTDADRLFAQVMIPHHEGAIDMARVQLQYGKDPELRKLAEEIIAAQEGEIAVLRDWLERQPAAP
ncbi:CopM family metallochaperone [Geminicoccus flavidas]|uniref:CopM family metallochaperone n=1 Tax=Geminicoccus flavidas TaxID=2506407 RepID=UPI001F3A2272|nr:DUF305 domain-containing protein [Geminicoccus flavidas]